MIQTNIYYDECFKDHVSTLDYPECSDRVKNIIDLINKEDLNNISIVKPNEVKKSLRTRTLYDKKRYHNPLKKVADAVLIRTDILNKKAMIAKMSEKIDEKMKLKYGRNFKRK